MLGSRPRKQSTAQRLRPVAFLVAGCGVCLVLYFLFFSSGGGGEVELVLLPQDSGRLDPRTKAERRVQSTEVKQYILQLTAKRDDLLARTSGKEEEILALEERLVDLEVEHDRQHELECGEVSLELSECLSEVSDILEAIRMLQQIDKSFVTDQPRPDVIYKRRTRKPRDQL